MVRSPKSQEKLALLEDTFMLWLYVRLVLYHIPSVQIPQLEKHGASETSMELGTSLCEDIGSGSLHSLLRERLLWQVLCYRVLQPGSNA